MHESHLQRTAHALRAAQSFVAPMLGAAEAAAARLAAGGKLWLSGAPGPMFELFARAGGMMMIRRLHDETVLGESDVILHFHAADKPLRAGGWPVVFTPEETPAGRQVFVWKDRSVSDTLGQIILGWLFTGELIAALTRLSRMPVIYQSIGMYEGLRRMETYREGQVAFHADRTVPAVEPGVLPARFIETVHDMLKRVEKQKRVKLDRAGAWARASLAAGGKLYLYAMGHGVPREAAGTAIGGVFTTGVWNAGFLTHPRPDHVFGPADFVAHVGYQHPPDDLFRRARPAGAKVLYVCLRPDREVAGDDGVIWIDPMWDWADACVPLDGYDVPILPASGIVNAAIAWELHRLTTVPAPTPPDPSAAG